MTNALMEVAPSLGRCSNLHIHIFQSDVTVYFSGVTLGCGQHQCPSKCHQLFDHSKMQCKFVIKLRCPKGHNMTRHCYQPPVASCFRCDREAKLAEEKRQKEFDLQQKRDAEKVDLARKLKELEDQIEVERQKQGDVRVAREMEAMIRQKQEDLRAAAALTERMANQPSSSTPKSNAANKRSVAENNDMCSTNVDTNLSSLSDAVEESEVDVDFPVTSQEPSLPQAPSSAEQDWQRQKDLEGAFNEDIDKIMKMIGLNDVKETILTIKAKIDTTKRQGTSIKNERFNVVLLGNPGTGSCKLSRKRYD